MTLLRCKKCDEIFDSTYSELEVDKDGNFICDDCYERGRPLRNRNEYSDADEIKHERTDS